jgi:hypothetical protein
MHVAASESGVLARHHNDQIPQDCEAPTRRRRRAIFGPRPPFDGPSSHSEDGIYSYWQIFWQNEANYFKEIKAIRNRS